MAKPNNYMDPAAAKAAEDFKSAQVIVLSTNGSKPLPQTFKPWIASMLKQRRDSEASAAIVALLGVEESEGPGTSRDFQFIKQLAQNENIEFFQVNKTGHFV
jgi:hypothetical protein